MRARFNSLILGSVCAACIALTASPGQAQSNPLDGVLSLLQSLFDWSGNEAPLGDSNEEALPVQQPQSPPGDLFSALASLSFEGADKPRQLREGETLGVVIQLSQERNKVVSVGVEVQGPYLIDARETLQFAPGETMKEFIVHSTDDAVFNNDERRTSEIRLTPPTNGVPMNAQLNRDANTLQVVLIDNDDPPPPPKPPAELVGNMSIVEFGQLYPGQNASQTFVVRNTGGQSVTMQPARIEPRDAFSVSFDECVGVSLNPGQICEMGLFFSPLREAYHKATLNVTSSDGTLSVPLEGFAVPAPVIEDPRAAVIASLKAQRRAGQGSISNFEIPPELLPEKPQYVSTDPDWGAIGIGRTYWSLPLEDQVAARLLTVHRVIPCVIEDHVRSELPGPVTCQVEQNVFAAGGSRRFVLIPAGTQIVGSYEGLNAQGDTRLNIVWQRFIRPDLSSVAIGDGFQGADAAGSTGIPGYINKRIVERFGTPVFLTLLTAGATALVPADDDQFSAAAENLTQGIGDVATQLLEENLDIRPTMDIPSGTRITIRPLVDLWFPTADLLVPAPEGVATGQTARSNGGG